MKYLILIHGNQINWETLSDEQRRDFGRRHFALTDELADSGELITSEGLTDPALATSVSVRDGQTFTTDGPYAEAKEHVVGFYLIECDGLARAVEVAARVPDAEYGQVEVRPVLDVRGMEM